MKNVYKKLFGEKLKDAIKVIPNKDLRTFISDILKVLFFIEIDQLIHFFKQKKVD